MLGVASVRRSDEIVKKLEQLSGLFWILAMFSAPLGCAGDGDDGATGMGGSGLEGDTETETGNATITGSTESGGEDTGGSSQGTSAPTSDVTSDGETNDAGDGDGDGDGGSTDSGDGDVGTSGDGDAGTSGNGDGDGDGGSAGDGDGDPNSGSNGDGDGDAGSGGDGDGDPSDDSDNDGIPDESDPLPSDPNGPVTAQPNLVYAHTSNTLYTIIPGPPYTIETVGAFSFDQSGGSVTDIAIDSYGVLYAVTFNDLFVCDPVTAACVYLADLPQSFNGLTMVPPGVLHPTSDSMIGIANTGAWYQLDPGNGTVNITQLGTYGAGYTSSGDAFSISGVGTYGAVNKSGVSEVVIVSSDPTTGTVQSEIANLTGYSSVYGLAGWFDTIFAFSSNGDVLEVDSSTGTWTVVQSTSNSWWGAGVYTILPQ